MGKGHEQSDGRQREKNKQLIHLKCHTISLTKLRMEIKKIFSSDRKKKMSEFDNTGSIKGLGQNTSVNWHNVHKKENCTAGNLSCT